MLKIFIKVEVLTTKIRNYRHVFDHGVLAPFSKITFVSICSTLDFLFSLSIFCMQILDKSVIIEAVLKDITQNL